MTNFKKLFAAVLVAGAATFAFAAPAHADSLRIGLNLGGGGYYQPAPVYRQVVYQPVVYRPAPRPVHVTYVDKWHGWGRRWEPRAAWRGWHHDDHIAYGYGRGW